MYASIKKLDLTDFRLVIAVRDYPFMNAFGARVRELRLKRNWSQEQLGHRAQITLSQVARIEHGKTNPTICTVKVLATALEMPVGELMTF